MQTTNTILEDISAEIGYTATSALCGWFGGRVITIPETANGRNRIAKVIGPTAFTRLVSAFGGMDLFIPKDRAQKLRRRDRIVFDMLSRGRDIKDICNRVRLSKMHVHNIRRNLEEEGLLPMILTASAAEQDAC